MSTKGIWTVTRKEDGNYYINCSALGRVFHPAQLCTVDGLGIWDYEDLKDLAVAILSFEEEDEHGLTEEDKAQLTTSKEFMEMIKEDKA